VKNYVNKLKDLEFNITFKNVVEFNSKNIFSKIIGSKFQLYDQDIMNDLYETIDADHDGRISRNELVDAFN